MGEGSKKTGIVDFSDTFTLYYNERYPEATVDKIDDFIEHVESNGLFGWIGKVSPSDRVPENYPNREETIAYARNNKLWHAHIGDPCFEDKPHGKFKTSAWVIHFQKHHNYHIKLLELDLHNPMKLPSEENINGFT
ncbi:MULTISPECIES: hypothetical protein [Vibrio]|nr:MULTISPECIES: hypothetical protein [Vibrio]EJE4210385.1 hypothetical protein [Vibrio parahaemolyticus]MBO0152268.1 hypothetical protein [Vibrio parahaemolyticus]MDW1909330.1 hypothetical protein [Vibrio sp. 707]MDW1920820.1 hypothetical protein [Vibrio sp. 736]MDW2043416.1 hypothetical protein [Vibrio sp. 708]